MSPEPTPPQTPADVVADDLRRYGAEILPGAVEKVAALWSTLGKLPAPERAEAIADRLRPGGLGEKFLNPEFRGGDLENGAEASPLRRELQRYAGQLREGAVDDLVERLAVRATSKGPGQLAKMVSSFIASRDADGFQATARDSRPPHEKRVVDRLREHFPELSYSGAVALAKDRGMDLSRLAGDSQFVVHVGRMLSTPIVATKYMMAEAIPADDHRLAGHVVPPSVATRGADGRFQQPPSTRPPARRIGPNF